MGCKKKTFYITMPHKVQRCEDYKGYHTQKGTKAKMENISKQKSHNLPTKSKTVAKPSGTHTRFGSSGKVKEATKGKHTRFY